MVIARLDILFPWQYHADSFIYLRSSFNAYYFICSWGDTIDPSFEARSNLHEWDDIITISRIVPLYEFAYIQPSNLISHFKVEALPGKNLSKNLMLTKRLQNKI